VEDRAGETEESGFLPPKPAGPEPELRGRPPQAPPPAPQPQPAAQAPPPQTYGYPPPPPGQAYPPPPPGQSYTPPPGYAYPPQWGYAPQPVPDNGPAVAGFVFAIVSIGLLVVSAGISSILSVGCAIVGIVYSRRGRSRVDAGETPRHRGLAQAGFIVGWVSLGLSVLATIFWALALAFAIGDDSSGGASPNTVRVTAAAVHAGARLIGS
jgi:hypothetical protein